MEEAPVPTWCKSALLRRKDLSTIIRPSSCTAYFLVSYSKMCIYILTMSSKTVSKQHDHHVGHMTLLAVMLAFMCVAATTTGAEAARTSSAAPTTVASTTATLPMSTTAASTPTTQATTHATTVVTTIATTAATTASTTVATTTETMVTTGTSSDAMTTNFITTSNSTANITTPTSTGNISTTSAASPTTGPTDGIKWHVWDDKHNLCMLMDFNGTISYKSNSVEIPDSARTGESTCSSSKSKFVLKFAALGLIWELSMSFTHSDQVYTMTSVAVTLYEIHGLIITSSSSSVDVEVPIGSYYSCDYFNVIMLSFNVNLTKPRLQPFVEQIEGGTGLGKEFVCGSNNHHGANAISIFIGVVIAIIVISAAVGLTWFLVKRRNSGGPHYSTLT